MRSLFILIFLTVSLFSLNFEISHTSISNGATSLIEFTKSKDFKYEKISLGKKSFKIYDNPIDTTKSYALIPVSYYDKPSKKSAKIHYRKKNIVIILPQWSFM